MLGAIATAAFVFAAGAGAGATILRLLKMLPERTDERLLWSVVVGQPFLALVILLAGVLGHLDFTLVIICAICVISGWFAVPWRRSTRGDAPAPSAFVTLLRLLIILSVCYAFLRSATPPTHKDSLGYHLAAPKIYLEQGEITRLDGMPRAWWPATAQMMWLPCMALSDHRAVQVFNGLEMLWAALALAVLGRRIFRAEAGLVAAAIFLTLRHVTDLAASGTDMFFLSLFATAALLALTEFRDAPSPGALLRCGVALGAAAGTKLPGLVVVAVILVVLLLCAPRRARAVLTVSLVALLVASPWYSRLAAYTGNPLWPFLGPGSIDPGMTDRLADYARASGHGEMKFYEIPYAVTLWRSNLLLAAALLLVFSRRWSPTRRMLLWAWGIGAAAWWLSSPQTRLGMPIHGWLAVLAGGAIDLAVHSDRFARAWRVAAAALSIALIAGHLHHKTFRRVGAGAQAILGKLDRTAYLKRERPMALAYEWVNAHAPEEPVLLYNGSLLYLRDGPWIVGDRVWQGRWDWGACTTADNFWDLIRSTGARYVIVDAGSRALPARERAFFGDRPVMRIDRGRVFRVPSTGTP